MAQDFPDTPSSDYVHMQPYWHMVDTMLQGASAMRAAGETYLPRFESETTDAYRLRKRTARFTNIIKDIIEDLAARPFSKEVSVKASAGTLALLEDADGQGNHINRFLGNWFYGAIARGIEWCLVDYSRTDPYVTDASGVQRRKSVAEEKQSGARPYLLSIKATDLIAVYSDMVDGKEQIVHARIKEVFARRSGYLEQWVTQIRILNREPIMDGEQIVGYEAPTFEVIQAVTPSTAAGLPRANVKSLAWQSVDSGPIMLGYIPLYPLVIGERVSGWRVTPALESAVELQKEYFEAENGLKNVKTLTAYPMLSASGVTPAIGDDGKVVKAPVGPRAVLYAPPSDDGRGQTVVGKWEIIEPAGTSLNFLAADLKDLAKELRELGRQPLTVSSGMVTVIAAGVAAQKGDAAIKNWAMDLKDAAENALKAFVEWDKETQEPEVTMSLDFSLEYSDKDTFQHVRTMQQDGVISKETELNEAKRRGIVSEVVDFKAEQDKIVDEMPDEPDEGDLTDASDRKPGELMSPEDEEEGTENDNPN